MSKVSIIISIYNVENYVRKTIDSVVKQTESDIEIILVDDGSTDTSGKICDEYMAIDSRIKVIHKKNGGLSSARNVGIQSASSKYIMLLDGDDYLADYAVDTLLKVMKQYPSDFIQYYYIEVEEGKIVEFEQPKDAIYQAHTSKELFENLYKIGGVAASGCTKLLKKELLLENPFITIRHEDEMWCTQTFQKPLTVTYIPDILYFYVMRENSIIHSTFNEKKFDIFTIIQERITVLRQLKLDHLLHIEYKRMYNSILSFYCEAIETKNQIALTKIKKQFMENKHNIRKYANLSGKFKVLFELMYLNYNFVKGYKFYWERESKNG